MGLLSRLRRRQPLGLDDRSPQLGLKVSDMLVLEQIVKAGGDPRSPRHVLYYLYFEHEDGARAASADVGEAGFDVRIQPPDPERSDRWLVLAERHNYVLELDVVRDNTDFFESVAERNHGDFDGWEASIG